jgi:general secretion pathway protein G
MYRNHDERRRLAGTHGLTLVEVLAVLVILGLIAATLVVGFSGVFGKAKQELARSGIGVVVSKLELYRMSKSAYPPNDVGLAALTDGQSKPSDAHYLSQDQLLDPWNRKWLYVSPGPSGHPFEVATYGADGQPGGEGEDADVSSTALRKKEGT